MTVAQRDRRQTLVILPTMQRRFIVRATLLPAIALVVLGAAIAVHCSRILADAAAQDVDLPGLRFLMPAVLAFVFAMAGLIARQATHFSNRVGGPAYRLVQSMRQLRAGELRGPVRLRDGDYLQEVADELNELIAWLGENRPAASIDGSEGDDEPATTAELPAREIGAAAD